MQTAIRCSFMRGGTSKGLYFLARDLPKDAPTRDRVLLAAMGSPDARQIDGVGGAHPLTSKVAIVSASERNDADVDYLFLQVPIENAEIGSGQNCGNILAGVAPFAIESGLVAARPVTTSVRIHMVNTGAIATAHVQTPNGKVDYEGDAVIDGVPGKAAPVLLDFENTVGSTCGALLPTGNAIDLVDGIKLTCIDNGMPVVVLNAADFGKTGYEFPDELEADAQLKAKIEALRLQLGTRMNLGDVATKTVPKMTLVAAPQQGGTISTRTFIPHRIHDAIGVLGAVSIATACIIPGSIAHGIASASSRQCGSGGMLDIEHPSGFFSVRMDVDFSAADFSTKVPAIHRASLLRTARLLMRGEVMIPASVWSGPEGFSR